MASNRCLIAIAALVAGSALAADPAGAPSPYTQSSEKLNASKAAETTHYGSTSSSMDIGYHGWGLRAGMADDVDQVVGGAHMNMGEFIPHLRFQPDIQLGAGDDVTTIYATAPVYWRFETETRFVTYVGGGPTVGWVDYDDDDSLGNNSGDSDFEAGAKLTGGMEWPRPQGEAFFVELSLGFGDVHDVTALAAWTF